MAFLRSKDELGWFEEGTSGSLAKFGRAAMRLAGETLSGLFRSIGARGDLCMGFLAIRYVLGPGHHRYCLTWRRWSSLFAAWQPLASHDEPGRAHAMRMSN